MPSDKKIVLITGASSGIGKAIAVNLIQKGYLVYGAARSVDKMDELVSLGGRSLYLDVTDKDSVIRCVNTIVDEQGRIDVLINNAGYGSYGALENVSLDEARKQMEVNLFGLAQMIKLVLPVMRFQKSGRIINISSIAGKLTSPLGSWYFASKHAVEGLSDSLRQEVKQFGIDVVVVEPGGVKSEWAGIAKKHLLKSSENTPYENLTKKVVNYFPFLEEKNAEPQVIADLVFKAISSKKPKIRYVGGYLAKPLLFAKKILSDKLYDAAVRSQL